MAAAADPVYTVKELPNLPGYQLSAVTSINEKGEAAGACSNATGSIQVAVVWRAGGPVNLGKLTGGNYASGAAINAKGVVVGDGDTGNFRPQSWVSTPSGLYNFFSNNGGNTHALSISDTGVIGGFYTKSLSGWVSSWRAAIWTPDPKKPDRYKQTDLPILVGPDPTFKGTCAIPSAFNNAGQAAGYATNEVIGQHACFWNGNAAHTIVDLGVYQDDWSSLAWGLNNAGQAVGESHPPFGSRPVAWDSDAAHTAIALPFLAGDNYGSAYAINDLGHVLGWSAVSTPGTWDVGPSRYVIWRDGGVYALQSLIDPVTGAGFVIDSVGGMNRFGQIVAIGHRNGVSKAVVLTPAK